MSETAISTPTTTPSKTTTTTSDLENSPERKFASEFKPTFSASKLAEICSPRSRETTRLKFLCSFRPFSDIVTSSPKVSAASSAKKSSFYKPRNLLTEAEKADIKHQLDENIDLEELTFDDDRIRDRFEERLLKSSVNSGLEFLMDRLTISTDNNNNDDVDDEQVDDSDPESAYVTAQSDEDSFKKYCDKDSAIEAKSKQAIRYISSMRGRKMERFILEKINKSYEGYNFATNKTKKYVDYGKFKIVGIIDGVSETKKTILEIKTRKNFEEGEITRRERLQALTYMNMFGCERCLFVESGPSGEMRETMLEYDEAQFKREVFDLLDKFTERARAYDRVEFESLLLKYNLF